MIFYTKITTKKLNSFYFLVLPQTNQSFNIKITLIQLHVQRRGKKRYHYEIPDRKGNSFFYDLLYIDSKGNYLVDSVLWFCDHLLIRFERKMVVLPFLRSSYYQHVPIQWHLYEPIQFPTIKATKLAFNCIGYLSLIHSSNENVKSRGE